MRKLWIGKKGIASPPSAGRNDGGGWFVRNDGTSPSLRAPNVVRGVVICRALQVGNEGIASPPSASRNDGEGGSPVMTGAGSHHND